MTTSPEVPITITIQRHPLSATFEVGSIDEVLAVLEHGKEKWAKLCGLATEFRGLSGDPDDSTALSTGTVAEPGNEAPAKRGRKAKAGPDPITATAPVPIAPPAAATPEAPTAPGQTATPALGADPLEIPAGLIRTAAPPPPPLMPSAPPVAPAAPTPPVGVLGQKVAAELERRAAGTPDAGASLVAWLSSCGLVVASAKFEEAVATVRMTNDDKMAPIAAALQIAA